MSPFGLKVKFFEDIAEQFATQIANCQVDHSFHEHHDIVSVLTRLSRSHATFGLGDLPLHYNSYTMESCFI